VSSAATGRLGNLFRWLGLTLVLLLALQLLAVLAVNGWGEESFRQLLSTALITQSPMAFVGLLLMLLAARLEDPAARRSPLQWFVAVVSGLLSLALLVTIPVTISGDRAISEQADQALMAQKGQLAMARAQLQNPQVIEQVIAQGERAGQIPATATEAQKQQAAKAFMDRQLKQADEQLKQAENRRDLAVNQRRIGGIGTAIVLLLGFALLALVAVL
jgi:ABC-type multidrug transport system fused ATPase/permease subunit